MGGGIDLINGANDESLENCIIFSLEYLWWTKTQLKTTERGGEIYKIIMHASP